MRYGLLKIKAEQRNRNLQFIYVLIIIIIIIKVSSLNTYFGSSNLQIDLGKLAGSRTGPTRLIIFTLKKTVCGSKASVSGPCKTCKIH
jgi:hypothetical protein